MLIKKIFLKGKKKQNNFGSSWGLTINYQYVLNESNLECLQIYKYVFFIYLIIKQMPVRHHR